MDNYMVIHVKKFCAYQRFLRELFQTQIYTNEEVIRIIWEIKHESAML